MPRALLNFTWFGAWFSLVWLCGLQLQNAFRLDLSPISLGLRLGLAWFSLLGLRGFRRRKLGNPGSPCAWLPRPKESVSLVVGTVLPTTSHTSAIDVIVHVGSDYDDGEDDDNVDNDDDGYDDDDDEDDEGENDDDKDDDDDADDDDDNNKAA